MGLFKKSKRHEPEPSSNDDQTAADDEHAVLIHFKFSDGEFGSEAEREAVMDLEDRLAQAVEAAGSGEFDGNEFGGGEAVLYLYGPDKDRLWQTIEPLVRQFPIRPAYALLRPGGPDVTPEQIHL